MIAISSLSSRRALGSRREAFEERARVSTDRRQLPLVGKNLIRCLRWPHSKLTLAAAPGKSCVRRSPARVSRTPISSSRVGWSSARSREASFVRCGTSSHGSWLPAASHSQSLGHLSLRAAKMRVRAVTKMAASERRPVYQHKATCIRRLVGIAELSTPRLFRKSALILLLRALREPRYPIPERLLTPLQVALQKVLQQHWRLHWLLIHHRHE